MHNKIPSEFIDQLIARVDIVDVIDRRVPLKRAGSEYKACCPFHDEKTPSFTVSPSKQFYHCFGCGEHGTAIGFLMNYANLSFLEAVEELAEGVNMEIPHSTVSATSGSSLESINELLGIVEEASRWFQRQLRQHPDAHMAIDYLKSRGVSGKISKDFKLGFAANGWDNMAKTLATTTKREQQLIKTGLLSRRESGGAYDRFRGRIIFPIEDHRGRIIGFGGRIYDQGEPKYLNSPETPLFHKGRELYGLHHARREIAAENCSLVVEGYMDVIGLAQHGIENAVATLGTATTRSHLQRLFRLAPDIVFCFDGDRAGRDAAWRALENALPEMYDGRQISFLFLPEGEDPDSVVRSEGTNGFKKRLQEAVSLPEFFFGQITADIDLERMDGKARLVSQCRPLLEKMPAGVLNKMMLDRLELFSGLSQMTSTVNAASTYKNQADHKVGLKQSHEYKQRHKQPHGYRQPGIRMAGLERATWLLLLNPSLAAKWQDIQAIESLNYKGADLFLKLLLSVREMESPTTARLLESWRDSKLHRYLEDLASRPNILNDDDLEVEFIDTLEHLINKQIDQQISKLLQKSRTTKLDKNDKNNLLKLQQQKENTRKSRFN